MSSLRHELEEPAEGVVVVVLTVVVVVVVGAAAVTMLMVQLEPKFGGEAGA
jgi:hypothetical protein